MPYPSELKYTKDHEWVRISGDTAEVGITDDAQEQLGDVVFVELPSPGTTGTTSTFPRCVHAIRCRPAARRWPI